MKKIAYIGCLGLIGVITTEFGVIGILPQLAGYYRISIDTAGLLLSVFAIVIALAGPFMTLFLSGYNRKYIMAISLGVFLLTGIVSALSPPFWLLLLVRMLPAFLQPVYISTAIAAATNAAAKKDEHKMMAIVLGGIGIATVSTVPFATYLAGVFQSWNYSFVAQAVVSLLALTGILTMLPSMPVPGKKSYGKQLEILKKPAFLISSVVVLLMNAAMFTTYAYFAEYLGRVNGMTPKTISSMLLLFGLMGVLGNFVAGKALSKNLNLTTAAFLAGLVLVAVGIYFSGPWSAAAVLLIGIWGFLHTPCFLTGQAYMIATAREAPEFANSISISVGNLGIAIGTALSGWVIAGYGIHYAPWVMLGFSLIALIMMLFRK